MVKPAHDAVKRLADAVGVEITVNELIPDVVRVKYAGSADI